MQPAKSIAIGLTAMLLLANAANPERKLRMDHVQDAIDAIYEAIDAKDPAAVTVQTRAIADAFVIEQGLWRDAGKPDRAGWATDSADRARAIADAAGAQNWTAASTALGALNQPCRACHDQELPAR